MDVLFVDLICIVGVLLSCEPNQPFFEHVDFQRVKTCDQDIDAKVELEPVDKVRV